MFIPSNIQLGEFDLNKAKQFVDYWSKLYSYDSVKCFNTEEKIDYVEELNIGNQLTENNVKRLLRWKDPRINYLLQYLKKYSGQINYNEVFSFF